jgi:hypothetical protein
LDCFRHASKPVNQSPDFRAVFKANCGAGEANALPRGTNLPQRSRQWLQ